MVTKGNEENESPFSSSVWFPFVPFVIFCKKLLRREDGEAVEALGAGGGGGIDDLDWLAVAGDGIGEGVSLVGSEVVGVFDPIDPGAPCVIEGLPGSVGSRGFARRLWRNGDNCICIPVAVLSGRLRRRTLAGSCGSVPRVP